MTKLDIQYGHMTKLDIQYGHMTKIDVEYGHVKNGYNKTSLQYL